MTHLPNIITLLRIAGSLSLLLCDVMGVAYWIIYGLCGISDIADGWLARKLKCVTRTGALLDSLADICFVACCAWKLLPILDSALPLCYSKELPQWLWLWAEVIVVIKVVNQLSALVMYGRFFLDKLASCQVVKLSLSPLLAYAAFPVWRGNAQI